MLAPYVKTLFLIPFTLLPIINPLSTAPVFVATVGRNRGVAKRLARQVALNSLYVMTVSMLVGSYVLEFFGISLPIVRIGGGLIVAATGWRMLNRQDSDEAMSAVAEKTSDLTDAEIVRRSFFPITFPLTTGPGTISAAIALGASIPHTPLLYMVDAVVSVAGAALTAAVLYVIFRNSARLLDKLGEVGTLVMMRFMAFILLCIGIEIMWAGWSELNHIAR
ncbi:MAG TPA: NAAT family transporter [Candidatus Aquabacterium excrementipullorum]|nr:NAAT family transporter [Candidatus Aquabacterium excrementipullorum]